MRAPWFTTCVVICAALVSMGSTGGACGGQVLFDPGFDLWCGDKLCAWKVERGTAMRAPTWHEGDAGVELVGTDSAIEQLSPVNSGDATCIKFDLVANIEDSAEVYLNVDVQSDGALELHERLPTARWKALTFTIYVPGPYDGIRFELAKRGTGRAVLANIGASTTAMTSCQAQTPLDPGPRKNGATCATGADCASGTCLGLAKPLAGHDWVGLVCAGCDPMIATSCKAGESCSVGDPVLPVLAPPIQCEPKATRELGELCIADANCASGICFKSGAVGVCSSCRGSADCATGACTQSWSVGADLRGPWVCNAGPRGAPCGNTTDCASGSCSGAVRKQCSDGRSCSDAADCPFGTTGSNGLHNGPCTVVGIQGGTCD